MDIKNAVKQWLTEKENKRYAKQLQEKQVSYLQWIREREEARDAIAAEEQESLFRMTEQRNTDESAEDDYVFFLASEGVFLYGWNKNISRYFAKHSHVMILYGDEEVGECGPDTGSKATNGKESVERKDCDADADEVVRKMPWFKPGWSPDVWNDYFYFGSAVAVKGSVLREMAERGMSFQGFAERKEVGSFIKKYMPDWAKIPLYQVTDAGAYRSWMQACVELVGGFKKGNHAIGHMPEVWFSCESELEQKKFLDSGWGINELTQDGQIGAEPVGKQADYVSASVSVVIPSKDNPELLEKCIRSCCEVTGVSENSRISSLEIIVVDNGSAPEMRIKIENFVDEFNRVGHSSGAKSVQIRYLYQPMEFNFSRMCNLGAAEAKGAFLLFLNDDVELCLEGTLEEMVALAAREYTGAVGLKLFYPGTNKMQHAGITNLPMGPVHKLQFLQDDENYYYNSNRGNRNVLAVTAACLMVEKNKFREAGGFSEELRVAFNDVDFCFALYEAGYHNVCVNEKYAYHHESLSRGTDESEEKLNRLLMERNKLYTRHPELAGIDPYYSEHLNRDGLDTRIRPGYVTAGNKTQQVTIPLKKMNPAGYRQDACLMVRVEDFRDGHAVGYGVVLGDNNACYEKMLLFQEKDTAEIYTVSLEGQYRPDLEENMPDQVNVALSGYDVQLQGVGEERLLSVGESCLPKAGTYRIGMAARNRITGLKLINWTNRYVEL